MIFDKTQMFADDLAHDGTGNEIDLGAAEQGRGEPLEIFFQGHSLTTASDIKIALQTATSSGGSFSEDAVWDGLTAAEANAGMTLTVPANAGIKQYAKLVLSDTSDGTYTAGIVLRGSHNNP